MASNIDSTDILFITVNEHETKSLSNALTALNGAPKQAQGKIHREPYDDYGYINGQHVVHAFSMMGSSLSGASEETTKKAIEDLAPKLLIAVGIAWGAWEDKDQKIGDVLISQQVQIGNPVKHEDKRLILRGPRPEMEALAIKHIQAVQRNQLSQITIHTGVVLSRDELFDSKKLRDKFRTNLPEMKGGEMEGQGIYQAIRSLKSPPDWLIVKGICDWGYKKNAHANQKKRNQILAAESSTKLCVAAIATYHLVVPSEPQVTDSPISDIQSDVLLPATKINTSVISNIGSSDASTFLIELTSSEIDIELVGPNHPSSGALVYWPVRIRKPTIVHAVQTFIAAALQERGYEVRLCFDDLGTPDGFASTQDGVNELAEFVKKWASRTTSIGNAEQLVKNARRFSEFFGNTDNRQPSEGALEYLGDNLVKWLMGSDKLRKVLKESKLMDSENVAALDKKPRKLLSPAVVWTVLKLLTRERSDRDVITLGGEDEKPIWRSFPSSSALTITNILVPTVRGDMDSDLLRLESKREIQNAIQNQPEIKDWFVRYAWHLPDLLTNKANSTFAEKRETDNTRASQLIGEYVL